MPCPGDRQNFYPELPSGGTEDRDADRTLRTPRTHIKGQIDPENGHTVRKVNGRGWRDVRERAPSPESVAKLLLGGDWLAAAPDAAGL